MKRHPEAGLQKEEAHYYAHGKHHICLLYTSSSFISKKIPYTIRIILYALIACAIYIPTAMLMDFWFPNTLFSIGVFLPLLVANSLIVVKSESRFHRHKRGDMVVGLLCHTLGFFFAIMLVGMLREFIGSGSLFGVLLHEKFTVPAALYPFSGFILVGFLAAIVKQIKFRLENPRPRKPRYEEIERENEGRILQ